MFPFLSPRVLGNTPQLSSRQDDSSACTAGSFTANNGLNFNVTCGQNYGHFDMGSNQATDLADCLNQCARYHPACYGASFDTVKTVCWFKNESIYDAPAESINSSRIDVHSALANRTQLEPLDAACPFINETEQTDASTGYQFKIECGQDFSAHDMQGGQYHTDSLEECMERCADQDPLCYAAVWSPHLELGYMNCYMKTDNDPANLVTAMSNQTVHTALGNSSQVSSFDSSCNDQQVFVSNGKSYNVTCGHYYPGNDILHVHKSDLGSCIDACASYSNSSTPLCQCVAFEAASSQGWLNCWFKSAAAGSPAEDGRWDAAVVVGAANNSSSSNANQTSNTPDPSNASESSNSGSSSSKAWIAGAVIGPIAAILIAGALFWLWLRRGGKQEINPSQDPKWRDESSSDGAVRSSHTPFLESDSRETPAELADRSRDVYELGGSTPHGGSYHR